MADSMDVHKVRYSLGCARHAFNVAFDEYADEVLHGCVPEYAEMSVVEIQSDFIRALQSGHGGELLQLALELDMQAKKEVA